MPTVKVVSEKNTGLLTVPQGMRLSAALISAGYLIDQPCGGNGKCGKCEVLVNGKKELSCRYTVISDIEVELPQVGQISSISGALQSGDRGECNVLCLDIGTTTLALSLVSLDRAETVKVITATNPQRAFGADVISRIEYCQKNGILQLQSVLVEAVSSLVQSLFSEYSLSAVETMYVAGNTTMLHTFLGIDCSSIGVSPYKPSFLESKVLIGKEFGFNGISKIITLPGISSFVGADIVAGINYVGLPEKGKYNLLIDLGTNAEIVLFSTEKAYATAAAAGPCFEGANISCGMSALNGAVCAYSDDGKYSVIGDTQPCGICATGLIDLIAYLLKNETIDESGYMEDEEFEIAENVSLTQKDVREFQLAKSAVISAILCLLNRAGIGFDSVQKMYVAGGFSAGISSVNAAFVGLIPNELTDKFVAVNNSSLLGTIKFALSGKESSSLYQNAEYVDLSCDGKFSDLFFENMGF